MKKKAGLWIDHRQAIIVTNANGGEEIKQINSNLEKHVHQDSVHARSTDCGPEDKRERKFSGHLCKYYDQVISVIGDAVSILILGPGPAKTELKKRLASKHFPGRKIILEASDKLTGRQIAAKIRQRFSASGAL